MPSVKETPQQLHQRRLTERFGTTVLSHGWTAIPNLFLQYSDQLYLTSTQAYLIVHLWNTWWERYPHPTMDTLAQRIRKTRRCVQVNLHALTIPLLDEEGHMLRPALLEINRSMREDLGGYGANTFDFTPLLTYLESLVLRDAKKDSHRDAKKDSHRDAKKDSHRDAKKDSHRDAKKDSHRDAKKDSHRDMARDQQRSATGENQPKTRDAKKDSHRSDAGNEATGGGSESSQSQEIALFESNQNLDYQNLSINDSRSADAPRSLSSFENDSDQDELPPALEQEITRLSTVLGDADHLKQNLSQARRLYMLALASGSDEHAFLLMLKKQAQALTGRKVQKRMAYFFTSLSNAVDALVLQHEEEEDVLAPFRDVAERQRREREEARQR